MHIRARHAISAAAMLLVLAGGTLSASAASASTPHNINCAAGQSTRPFNTWVCHLPATGDVYLTSYPEQNEITCPNGDTTRARIQVKLLARRTATGFLMKGIWLRLDQGIEPYGWFQAFATDGNQNLVKTNTIGETWNEFGPPYGEWNPDFAVRGDLENITRNQYVRTVSPVWIGWGSSRAPHLLINMHEQTRPAFQPNDSGCIVRPFNVFILPG